MKKIRKSNTGYHLLVIVFGAALLYPIAWMILASFKTDPEILSNTASFFPHEWHFENYQRGWKGFGGISFATFFSNSFFVSAVATFLTMVSSAIAAHGFARVNFRGKKLWFAIMLITMMIPSQVLLIPQYIIFNRIGWVDSYAPLIVPSVFTNPFFVFLIMQFVQGIPRELDEAAIIDGCSRYGIFWRIILPLIKPALISTVVIQFYWKWDEFMGPLLYLGSPQKYTLSLAIKAFADATSTTDYGAIFSMSTLALIPVFLIFLFFNRYLVEGITMSGIKG